MRPNNRTSPRGRAVFGPHAGTCSAGPQPRPPLRAGRRCGSPPATEMRSHPVPRRTVSGASITAYGHTHRCVLRAQLHQLVVVGFHRHTPTTLARAQQDACAPPWLLNAQRVAIAPFVMQPRGTSNRRVRLRQMSCHDAFFLSCALMTWRQVQAQTCRR